MAVIETWLHQDLQKPVKVNHLDGSLFSNNGNGNLIGVVLTNNGESLASISGTVSGYVVTSDGSTVPCIGSKSGNRASILIPAAAYQPGSIFITVFVTDGTTVTTIGAVSTTVMLSRTNAQVDPGSAVTDWTQTINAAMQSVETAAANLGGIVAVPYASITFPVPLGKYTYYNNNLYRCITPIESSESFTAAHWTQVRLGDDVSELKSALNCSVDVSTLNWAIGSIQGEDGREFTSNTRIRCDYLQVTAGTRINVSGNHYCLSVVIYGLDKQFSEAVGFSDINNSYTVSEDCYVRLLIRVSVSNETITSADIETQYSRCAVNLVMPQSVYTLPAVTDALSEKVDQLDDLTTETVTKTKTVSPLWTAGGYKDANGYVQANASYSYSELIPVDPGDIVRSPNMRFVTAYKDETTTSYSDFKTDATEFTVSAVTHYIVISKANVYTSEPIYIDHAEKQNSAIAKMTILSTVCNGATGTRKTGNISNSSLSFIAFAAIRKGKTYSFYGKITAFNKLTIGCGTNNVNSSNIEIDTTNVKFNNASATIDTTAHGLTFRNYIYVIVNIDGNAFPTVTIYTDGGNFTKTYADEWIGSEVRVYATADDSTSLSGCVLTFSAADVKKNIWYCGDSYMAVRDGGKLPSKLKYFNVFQNLNSIGYSGAGSENVLPYVQNMFAMDLMPKYLVWAIGMNNGDTSSAVNATWKTGYDKLIELASGGNFELILATIPNTPTINNNFKNDIVRNSGYRYIDFADAVQTAEGENTWLTGMLSSDNVHPTAEGAKALASRLCADFPEIFN